jgi:hypothetical protein
MGVQFTLFIISLYHSATLSSTEQALLTNPDFENYRF